MNLGVFKNKDKFFDSYKFQTTYEYQNYIISYLYPENPYRSLVCCFKVGSGKTYISACLAHIYLDQGFSVLYISGSVNSLNNFKLEYEKVVNDNRFNILNSNLDIMTFHKMYYSESVKKYDLIIVDEAHNLKKGGSICERVRYELRALNMAKILILTATPMVDSFTEMDNILHLAGSRSDVLFTNTKNIDVKINYVGDKTGPNTLFLSKMKGLQLKEYTKLKSTNSSIYSNLRQASISSGKKYDPSIPLEEQSSKIFNLIKSLKPDKPTVVFCFFISRGIDFLVQVLENIGYTEYNKKGSKHYAVLKGGMDKTESMLIINSYNNVLNINGDIIHILIGSSVMSESITLFRTRELHILSPHWNFSQINQSIGRTVRIGSHDFLSPSDANINIYLHAAYADNLDNSIDIHMYNLCDKKDVLIKHTLESYKKDIEQNKNVINTPVIDNRFVFKLNNQIWDLYNCFDHNKYKISWCEIDEFKAEGYDVDTGAKIIGRIPSEIKINTPLPHGYTIWRSCVDNKLRLSFIPGERNKSKKYKRGKIITNMKEKEIIQTASDLNCSKNITSIIEAINNQGRFFDQQIEILK